MFCYFKFIQRAFPGFEIVICNTFWRGMKKDSKFTTISNSADTQGVCWLFGWEYCDDQSEKETLKKAENLKFEIWFIDLFIKMLISYFYESWSWMWRRLWDNRFPLNVLSTFHWERTWRVIRWNIVMFLKSVWVSSIRAVKFLKWLMYELSAIKLVQPKPWLKN